MKEGDNCCFTDWVKKNVPVHSDIYKSVGFKLGRMILLYSTVNVLDLDSRSQECEKAKTSAPIISQSFESIWMELRILLRPVGVLSLILMFSSIQYSGERSLLVWFLFFILIFTLACIQRFLQTNFFQRWSDDRDHWAIYFDMSLNYLDLHSRSQ